MSSKGPSLVERLPQLQNLIKRDPEAYIDEFEIQHRNFQAELDIFRHQPTKNSESFRDLIIFLSHVTTCYPKRLNNFPVQLMSLLQEHASQLDPDVRKTVIQALMLMRNRGFVEPIPLLKLFFELFRVQDKLLRELLFTHIVSDIKNMNHLTGSAKIQKNKKAKGFGAPNATVLIPHGQTVDHINRSLQSFMYSMIQDDNLTAARKTLDVLIELYRRKLWTDARTVNAMANACLNKSARIAVPAIRFFLGMFDNQDEDDSDESDAEETGPRQASRAELKAAAQLHAHSKHTRKRKRQAQRHILKMRQRGKDKRQLTTFPAVQLLHDPQGLAEKMLSQLRQSNHKFEVRLLQMNMISLLVGQHKLLLLNLYPFLQRYLTAHQKSVTQVMAYLIQACHQLVPPSELVPVMRCIADNFITDRCPDEVIQVGLNATREVIARCPAILEEERMPELIQDLVEYKRHNGDKGVVMASRSLLNLVRELYPGLLRRKDRGKDHVMNARPVAYGARAVAGGISGTELLVQDESDEAPELVQETDDEVDDDSDVDGSDVDGSDVDGSDVDGSDVDDNEKITDDDDEVAEENNTTGNEEKNTNLDEDTIQNNAMDNENDSDASENDDSDADEDESEIDEDDIENAFKLHEKNMKQRKLKKSDNGSDDETITTVRSSTTAIQRVESARFLTDEDFIMLKRARKTAAASASNNGSRKKNTKEEEASLSSALQAGKPLSFAALQEANERAQRAAMEEYSDSSDDEEDDHITSHVYGAEFSRPLNVIHPDSLEAGATLKKRTAAARRAEREQEKLDKKWTPKERSGGMTNREKARRKNFMMIRKSTSVQAKMKQSLQSQKRAIRTHLKGMSQMNKHKKSKRRRI